MAGPDRVPVADALGVVPHAVGVDRRCRPRPRVISSMRPSTCVGHAGDHVLRRRAEPLRPVAAHELVVAADAARGDDHRPAPRARSRRPPCASSARRGARALGSSTLAAHAVDRAAGDDQLVDAVAEAQLDEAARLRLAHAALERLDHARPGAPGDVEARHRVAVAGREVAAALGPADVGQEAHALRVQPRALLAGGEVDVGLGPAPRPLVLRRGRSRRCRASPARRARASRGSAAAAARGCRRRTARRTTRTPGRRATPRAPGRRRITRLPASASSAVATSPARPAPTTIASESIRVVLSDR